MGSYNRNNSMKVLKIGTLLKTLLKSKKGSRYEGPFWLQEL